MMTCDHKLFNREGRKKTNSMQKITDAVLVLEVNMIKKK